MTLFSDMQLNDDLVRDLRRMNPWWEGKPQKPLPVTRRHLVHGINSRLSKNLAPIVVVRGPRQIGKTTAQLQVLQDLLDKGTAPSTLIRIQFDELESLKGLAEPILRIIDWYEKTVLGGTLNEAAHAGRPVHLFLDEVQNLDGWAPQLKSLVDNSAVRIVLTGSSALRIGLGHDSLAGRWSTIEAGVLSLTEIGAFHDLPVGSPFLPDNGLEPLTRLEFWRDLAAHGRRQTEAVDAAFRRFSERGGYPLVHQKADVEWSQLADQLNETVIRRVILHDLPAGEQGRGRDAPLMEEVFRLCCRYVGQSPDTGTLAREAQRSLSADVGPQKIGHYLRFLGDTLLLRLIEPLEIRLKRGRGNLKICLADHGLRAAWLQENIPLDAESLAREPHLTALAGHIAESVTGATLSTITGLDLAHLPERKNQPEIDFVLTIGTKRIPMEVKHQRRIDPLRDTEGLRTFIETQTNNAPFGIIVTQTEVDNLPDPRIVAIPLSTLMLLR